MHRNHFIRISLTAVLFILAGIFSTAMFFQPSLASAQVLPVVDQPAVPYHAQEATLPPANTPQPELHYQTTIKATETLTPTETLTATLTLTPTTTLEPTSTPVPTAGILNLPYAVQLPLLVNQYLFEPVPLPERALYCTSPGQSIPDANLEGITLSLVIPENEQISDLNLYLDIDHTFIGDLRLSVSHSETGSSALLVDRVDCPNSDIIAVFDDDMPLSAQTRCGSNYRDPAGRVIPAIAGSFAPLSALDVFSGENAAGTWNLHIADLSEADLGKLNKWCLAPVFGDPVSTPEVQDNIPDTARIMDISGQNQALSLDCESRSAVDWAAYYGTQIDEMDFFYSLATSDNPDSGFVGPVWGIWGQIPPYPYGVHAEPVAEVLRSYGLPAYAHRPLSWDDARQEVAGGNPVLVFVIGSTSYNSPPYYYSSSDGHVSQVARYEHSAILIGYTPTSVTLLDGSKVYTRSLNAFLEGWSALGNMAITMHP